MFEEFPERVLADLPESIRKKIIESELLDASDCRVARSYLEKTIMHPENACDGDSQILALIRFYVFINARIPQATVDHLSMNVGNDAIMMELADYERITSDIIVSMNTSPLRNQSFLSVCHINSDKGFRRWNLYAENYGKLIKSIKRWSEVDASHLRSNCRYLVYVDEFHVGNVEYGRIFVPNPASEMYGFILKFFEPPIKVTLDFTLTESQEFNFENCYNFTCKIKNESKHNSMLILPLNSEMKYSLISKNITSVSRKILDLARFQESMSCDIEGTILLNGVVLALIDIDSGEPQLTDEGEIHLKTQCGLVTEEEDGEQELLEKRVKMTFFERIKFVFSG